MELQASLDVEAAKLATAEAETNAIHIIADTEAQAGLIIANANARAEKIVANAQERQQASTARFSLLEGGEAGEDIVQSNEGAEPRKNQINRNGLRVCISFIHFLI